MASTARETGEGEKGERGGAGDTSSGRMQIKEERREEYEDERGTSEEEEEEEAEVGQLTELSATAGSEDERRSGSWRRVCPAACHACSSRRGRPRACHINTPLRRRSTSLLLPAPRIFSLLLPPPSPPSPPSSQGSPLYFLRFLLQREWRTVIEHIRCMIKKK